VNRTKRFRPDGFHPSRKKDLGALPLGAAGAYWLLDEIALAQRHEKTVAGEEFQLWKLKVEPGHTATLTCEDGNGKAVYRKAIAYTDFPLPEVELYFTNKTILLPSEY
jgi:hypothetical protein